jgi:hypothetical protein
VAAATIRLREFIWIAVLSLGSPAATQNDTRAQAAIRRRRQLEDSPYITYEAGH